MNPLSVSSFAKISSHSVGCLFILLRVSFAVQKRLSLLRSQLFIFSFTVIDSKRWIWEDVAVVYVGECLAYVFLEECYSVCLIPRSLIHLEFLFVYGVGECSNFVLFHVAVQFSQHHSWRGCLFSIVYSCLLCHRLVDHRCMGLILGFLFYSTDHFCFCASTMLFWWL